LSNLLFCLQLSGTSSLNLCGFKQLMRRCFQTIFLLLLSTPQFVWAEGHCPDGYFPIGGGNAGWEGCAPMDRGVEESAPAPERLPRWEARWGAIATANGAFGAAKGMSSKAAAVSNALSQCRERSAGQPCSEKIVYYNQCAALAWGDGGNTAFRAPAITDAEASALAECVENTGNCQIFYSGCSYPEEAR
jgi:hypothetical protein